MNHVHTSPTRNAWRRTARRLAPLAAAAGLLAGAVAGVAAQQPLSASGGWLSWRGPAQNGTAEVTALPDACNPEAALWTVDLRGRGTPVAAGDRVYAFGYRGDGPDLQEVLLALDAGTGRPLWEHSFNDFLSDVIYDRYSIGSPTVDPETGNVYLLTSGGIFSSFDPSGKLVWQHSLMETLGRLTFPNGRIGAPLIEDDLVIIRCVTGNWGADGAASDRFYAFDKKSGHQVWSSTPGIQPRDNSFALPVVLTQDGKRVLYTGTGCGHIVALNARTGQPLWRYRVAQGGVNASSVVHGNTVIAIHDLENVDSSEIGRMVAVKIPAPAPNADGTPVELDRGAEQWRSSIGSFSSSPVLVGNRLYQVTTTGILCAIDADSGSVLWRHRLGPDQLHASPLYAAGKLYVPLQNGMLFVLRVNDTGVEEVSKSQLAGNCLGAPAVANGRLLVHTTEKLYCFGSANAPAAAPIIGDRIHRAQPGQPVALQVVPSEVLLKPGETATFTVRGIDASGFITGTYPADQVKWEPYIPPTARVRSRMNAAFNARGELVANADGAPSAGAFQAQVGELRGTMRGRVVPALPITDDFEAFELTESRGDVKFAFPPLSWLGGRFRWEVQEREGGKVLAKTLENVLFQRAITFIGSPGESDYSIVADVMSDGNRRNMSSVGVVNQRYMIALLGNSQELEISSNHERLKVSAPFAWRPGTWYRLKTRVDVAPNGAGTIRAKAWPRGEEEPAGWTLEAEHRNAHRQGAPGLFGFAPQSQFAVYVDNLSITPND
jgi:outer membrane protein assembly factor BamB